MVDLKNVYKQNKAVIICTAMLVFCAEVFCSILSYYLYFKGNIDLSFFGNMILRIASIIGGIYIAYRGLGRINVKYSPVIAVVCVVLTLLCSGSGFIDIFDFSFWIYPLSTILAVYFLAVYYINYCKDSVRHTLFYMLLGIMFIFKTVGEIEAFFIMALQLLLFVSVNRETGNKRIRLINIIYSIISAIGIIFLFVSNIYDYITFKFEEGHMIVRIKDVLKTMKPFGKTEFVSEIGGISSNYNLTGICGFFGYVTGIIVFIILTAFIISICVKAYKNKDNAQPAVLTAVTVLGLRYVLSLLINCGVLFGRIDVRIPVLSDGSVGYFVIGILLGLIFATNNKGQSLMKEKKH